MTKINQVKLFLLVALTVLAGLYVAPSFMKGDPEKSFLPFTDTINLGLDLQGGLYMVYEINFPEVFTQNMGRQLAGLRSNLQTENIRIQVRFSTDIEPTENPRGRIEFAASDKQRVLTQIQNNFPQFLVIRDGSDFLELGFSGFFRTELRESVLSQSIQVVRNRIDEFGVTEPTIVSQGNSRIVIELPGVTDIERAKALVGRTARLDFQIANNEEITQGELSSMIQAAEAEHGIGYQEGDIFSEYVAEINRVLADQIPEGYRIYFERPTDRQGRPIPDGRIPYLLSTTDVVSGDSLIDARVGFDQFGVPVVNFQLDPAAARDFENLTANNIGKPLAIVLDGVIYSAPNINSRIPGGRGQITLGRGGMAQEIQSEARDLAIVLRAGALPAELTLAEQRAIGPTLGADSIEKGLNAGLLGCALIFMFLLYYYRMSGAIAVVSLCLNALFVIAILVFIGATLTLPGMAGLALTIGMAVDSNVIIFERIRDELREGGSIKASVERGFERAFSCIVDGNITNAIVCLILLQFGTGPIKGFAVALLIGIFTTLFCAITVSRLLFDIWVKSKKDMKTLSI